MNINDLDLTQASRIYGISNTPLFLVRKLQQDPSIQVISEKYSGAEIVDALRQFTQREPQNSVEAVVPYALLVALFFKPNVKHLQEASKIEAAAYSWYHYISEALLLNYSPTAQNIVQVPGSFSDQSLSTKTEASNNFPEFDAA